MVLSSSDRDICNFSAAAKMIYYLDHARKDEAAALIMELPDYHEDRTLKVLISCF